jgi:hypothetical protein
MNGRIRSRDRNPNVRDCYSFSYVLLETKTQVYAH